eukprot:113121-Alexandrium_andersonii.AAC.1
MPVHVAPAPPATRTPTRGSRTSSSPATPPRTMLRGLSRAGARSPRLRAPVALGSGPWSGGRLGS